MLNHPRRRLIVPIALLTMSLGMGSTQTPYAQREAQKQTQVGTLKTVTLDGRGGPRKPPTLREGMVRPRRLTVEQRATLHKGRVPKQSFTLSSREPLFSAYSAEIRLYNPDDVYPYMKLVNFSTSGRLRLTFEAKVGKLYALVFSAQGFQPSAVFTITNNHTEATQTTGGGWDLPVIAYVSAESGDLSYTLTCSQNWYFYSVEVTEL